MKSKKCLFFFIIILFFNQAFSKSIVVAKINKNDCVKCILYLNQLPKKLNRKIFILLEDSTTKADTRLDLLLEDTSSFGVLINTRLFEQFSSSISMGAIIESDKIIYKFPLAFLNNYEIDFIKKILANSLVFAKGNEFSHGLGESISQNIIKNDNSKILIMNIDSMLVLEFTPQSKVYYNLKPLSSEISEIRNTYLKKINKTLNDYRLLNDIEIKLALGNGYEVVNFDFRDSNNFSFLVKFTFVEVKTSEKDTIVKINYNLHSIVANEIEDKLKVNSYLVDVNKIPQRYSINPYSYYEHRDDSICLGLGFLNGEKKPYSILNIPIANGKFVYNKSSTKFPIPTNLLNEYKGNFLDLTTNSKYSFFPLGSNFFVHQNGKIIELELPDSIKNAFPSIENEISLKNVLKKYYCFDIISDGKDCFKILFKFNNIVYFGFIFNKKLIKTYEVKVSKIPESICFINDNQIAFVSKKKVEFYSFDFK